MKVADKWIVYSVMPTIDADLIVVMYFFPPVPAGPTGSHTYEHFTAQWQKMCVHMI